MPDGYEKGWIDYTADHIARTALFGGLVIAGGTLTKIKPIASDPIISITSVGIIAILIGIFLIAASWFRDYYRLWNYMREDTAAAPVFGFIVRLLYIPIIFVLEFIMLILIYEFTTG